MDRNLSGLGGSLGSSSPSDEYELPGPCPLLSCQDPLSAGPGLRGPVRGGFCRFTLTTVATQGSPHQMPLLTIESRGSPTLASGPAAPAVPENTVEAHILRPHPRSAESETQRRGPVVSVLANPPCAAAAAAELREPLV